MPRSKIKPFALWKTEDYVIAHKRMWNVIIRKLRHIATQSTDDGHDLKRYASNKLYPSINITSNCFGCERKA